ncbi:uncharacterized protein LOC134267906 [Saccostrea cucullata]|uniref:uncharacterized protein LOC134267906 n=1 Tax=Saccostrea cuccullata TaxID=36930 RepID=UPI002ED207B5
MTEVMTSADAHSDPSADPIMDIIAGATRYKIMMQCIEIGLFDEIESLGETCTAETIAKKCGYDVSVLERLLSTLASYNLLQKDCNRKGMPSYRNSSGTSKYLTRSRRPTMIGLAMSVDAMIHPLLDNLPMLLKSGKPKLDINKNVADNGNILSSSPNHQKTPNNIMDKENNMGPGSPIKQNMSSMPHIPKMPCMPKMPPNSTKMPMEKNGIDYQAKFLMAMEGFSASCASSIVKAFDLSQHRSAVDLGGGPGRISFEMANTYPHMKITVFDLPPVIQVAQKMQQPCSQGQIFFKTGNFFEDEIPSADLYLLGHVIHGFDLKGIDRLLQKVYSKLPPGGSVLVMEKILAENRTEPELAVTNDFVMTLLSQGQERTFSDYQKLFSKHGFVNVQFKHIDGLNYYDVMLLKKPF